jgi:hypothetical protein
MATFSKIRFSARVSGKSIKVSQTTPNGNTIHIAQSGTTGFDEIWLYASNNSATTVKLTVSWGGTSQEDRITLNIPGESGLVLVVPGLILHDAETVRAFADTANVISIFGYVNRIS